MSSPPLVRGKPTGGLLGLLLQPDNILYWTLITTYGGGSGTTASEHWIPAASEARMAGGLALAFAC